MGEELDEEKPRDDGREDDPQTAEDRLPDGICKACRTNPVDATLNPGSELCASCREDFIKYPYPKWLVAVLAAVLVVVVVSFFRVPTMIQNYKEYRAAESAYDGRNYNAAANAYTELGVAYGSSMRIHERLFLALIRSQRFEDAATVLNDDLVGRNANDETYAEIDQDATLLVGYYDTHDKLAPIFQADPQIEKPEEMYAKILELRSDATCDQSILLSYLSQLNSLMGRNDVAATQVQEAYALQPKYTFLLSALGTIQRREGDYDAAAATYDAVLEKVADDVEANRGLGIVSLLQGDFARGAEYAKKAYDLNPDGPYIAETYAVALYAAGRTSEAKAVYATYMKSADYTPDTDYEDYLTGRSTLEKLYRS